MPVDFAYDKSLLVQVTSPDLSQCWPRSMSPYAITRPQWVKGTDSYKQQYPLASKELTHSGRVTHICVSNLTIIDSDNGLSPDPRQANICANAGILLIRPLEENFNDIFITIHTFSFKKIYLKMSSGKWLPFCLGLNELKEQLVFGDNNPLPINSFPPSATYMRPWIESALVQIMACRLFGAKPLSKPVLVHCPLDR